MKIQLDATNYFRRAALFATVLTSCFHASAAAVQRDKYSGTWVAPGNAYKIQLTKSRTDNNKYSLTFKAQPSGQKRLFKISSFRITKSGLLGYVRWIGPKNTATLEMSYKYLFHIAKDHLVLKAWVIAVNSEKGNSLLGQKSITTFRKLHS